MGAGVRQGVLRDLLGLKALEGWALSAEPRGGILTGALRLALAVPCPSCVNPAGAGVTKPPFPPNPREPFTRPLQGMELLQGFVFKGHGQLQNCALGRAVGK